MSLRSLTLLLAAAGGAAYLYRRRPGARPLLALPSPGGADRWSSMDADASDAGTLRYGERDRSMDRTEPMQDEYRLGTPVMPAGDMTGSGEGGPAGDLSETEELFGSSSRRSEAPIGTGLPDLTRGA